MKDTALWKSLVINPSVFVYLKYLYFDFVLEKQFCWVQNSRWLVALSNWKPLFHCVPAFSVVVKFTLTILRLFLYLCCFATSLWFICIFQIYFVVLHWVFGSCLIIWYIFSTIIPLNIIFLPFPFWYYIFTALFKSFLFLRFLFPEFWIISSIHHLV